MRSSGIFILIALLAAAVGLPARGQAWRLGVHASSDGTLCASGPRSFGVGDSVRAFSPPPMTETVAAALFFTNGELCDREVSAYVQPSGGAAKSWTMYAFGDYGYMPSQITIAFRTISGACLPPPLIDGQPWLLRVTMQDNRSVSGAPANGSVLGEFAPPTEHVAGSSFFQLDPLPAVKITSRDTILSEAYVLRVEQVVATERTIGDWKALGDGTIGRLTDAEVTVDAGDSFYVEKPDRTSGLRVAKTDATAVPRGTRVSIAGVIRTNSDGERFIDASSIATAAGSPTILPLGTTSRSIGGGAWQHDPSSGAGQEGASEGVGLNNTGLLMTVWGRPILTESPDTLALDDGSGRLPLVVLPQGSTHNWNAGSLPSFVTVTGASGLKKVGDTIRPAVYIGSFVDDVRVVAQ